MGGVVLHVLVATEDVRHEMPPEAKTRYIKILRGREVPVSTCIVMKVGGGGKTGNDTEGNNTIHQDQTRRGCWTGCLFGDTLEEKTLRWVLLARFSVNATAWSHRRNFPLQKTCLRVITHTLIPPYGKHTTRYTSAQQFTSKLKGSFPTDTPRAHHPDHIPPLSP